VIDLDPHKSALSDRIDVVRALIRETHPKASQVGPIARETRGLATVLLFAAYEEVLTSVTRTLLETAAGLRVSNRRLQPGFRAFAIHNAAKSLRNVSDKKLFVSALPTLVEISARGGVEPSIDTDAFPNDGSFMKRSQIEVWLTLFDAGQPAALLPNIWHKINTVVTQRNGIAHGRLTPQEVGRSYSEAEIVQLTEDWADDWTNFICAVEKLASSRDFFRTPR
jgi:hypothetical protein